MSNPTAEQIIARETERLMQNRSQPQAEMLDEMEVYKKLAAPFPKAAYVADRSRMNTKTGRGIVLTSLKAQFVIERLNEVLGFMNWSHGGEYQVQTDGSVIFQGALVVTINGKQNRFFSAGFGSKKTNMGDTYKSAKTDSLCKCASQIGVGNDAFKGLIDPDTLELRGASKSTSTRKTTDKKETSNVVEDVPWNTVDSSSSSGGDLDL